jgi:hypothetical protein
VECARARTWSRRGTPPSWPCAVCRRRAGETRRGGEERERRSSERFGWLEADKAGGEEAPCRYPKLACPCEAVTVSACTRTSRRVSIRHL